MELRVERDTLVDAVVWTARSLPARPPMQVLLGLLLEVDEQGLEISGFDYEVSSRVRLAATTDTPGRVLVPGRLLSDIVRSLPAQPVDLRVEGTRVVLTCGPARFTLPTLPVEDYPALPAMPAVAGTLGSDVFADAVAQVALAAGRDDTLPVLTGVRFEIEGDTLTLAATDRYRLAVRMLQWRPTDPDISTTALVPARTLSETAKALTAGPEVTLALAGAGSHEGHQHIQSSMFANFEVCRHRHYSSARAPCFGRPKLQTSHEPGLVVGLLLQSTDGSWRAQRGNPWCQPSTMIATTLTW